MSRANRKTRMISVRVTDEEYDRLKNLSESHGGSISDLTRDAVRALVLSGTGPVRTLDHSLALKVHDLECNLATIRQFLRLPSKSEL
jgi:hypothetical protein